MKPYVTTFDATCNNKLCSPLFSKREYFFRPIGAIIFKCGRFQFQNIFKEDVENNVECQSINSNATPFVFLPNEYLTKVEISSSRRRASGICGIRLFTSLRVSQWFGCYNPENPIHVLEAKSGYYVHSLGHYDPEHRIFQIGIFCRPLYQLDVPVDVKPHLNSIDLIQEEVEDDPLKIDPYRDVVDNIRAIILEVRDKSVVNISLLSNQNYNEYKDLENWIRQNSRERWFVLFDNETLLTVEAVKYEQDVDYNSRIKGVRFVTTMRTSLWYGIAPSNGELRSSFTVSPTQMICGIYGNYNSLGVIYSEKQDEDGGGKHNSLDVISNVIQEEGVNGNESDKSDTWSVLSG